MEVLETCGSQNFALQISYILTTTTPPPGKSYWYAPGHLSIKNIKQVMLKQNEIKYFFSWECLDVFVRTSSRLFLHSSSRLSHQRRHRGRHVCNFFCMRVASSISRPQIFALLLKPRLYFCRRPGCEFFANSRPFFQNFISVYFFLQFSNMLRIVENLSS